MKHSTHIIVGKQKEKNDASSLIMKPSLNI